MTDNPSSAEAIKASHGSGFLNAGFVAACVRDGVAYRHHNLSLPPSADDFHSQAVHNYDFGVIACHDGRVIMYKEDRDLSKLYEISVDKYSKMKYHEHIEDRFEGNARREAHIYACNKAIEEHVKYYNLRYEVL